MHTILTFYKPLIIKILTLLNHNNVYFTTELGVIIPQTKTAQATIKLLKLNDPDLLIIRQILSEAGRYP